MRNVPAAAAGGLVAAFLGSLCCIGPLVFVTFGVGAGLASTFEPLRPFFAALMVGLFAIAFYTVYGKAPDTAPMGGDAAPATTGAACAVPRSRRREKALLWSAAILALILWSFPSWSTWLI